MRNKNIWLLVISIIILIFDIAMGFILNAYSMKIVANDSRILYICVKCIVVILLIAIVSLCFLKNDTAHYALQYFSTLMIQFLPLAIRYLSAIESGFLVSIILTFVFLIIYTGIVLAFSLLRKRTIATAKKLEGKTIPVNEDIENEQNN